MPTTKRHPDASVWFDHQLQTQSRLKLAKVDPMIHIVGVSNLRHHIDDLNAKKAAIQQPMRIAPINR